MHVAQRNHDQLVIVVSKIDLVNRESAYMLAKVHRMGRS